MNVISVVLIQKEVYFVSFISNITIAIYSNVLNLFVLRFICDNLALPVPCHWERVNTDEPYQV